MADVTINKPPAIEYLYDVGEIGKMAVEIFGEERVFIESRGIFLHFPSIEITNSKGLKHTILDMYIRLLIDKNMSYSRSIDPLRVYVTMDGLRTTKTLKEQESGFRHSHLQRSDWGWGGWCFGSSNFRSIKDNLMLEPTKDAWYGFLLAIPRYLEWESLEGGPYMTMSSIQYSQHRGMGDDLFNTICKNIHELPLETWSLPRDVLNNSLNIRSLLHIKSYLKANSPVFDLDTITEEDQLKVIKGMTLPDRVIVWKGKGIPAKVIPTPPTEAKLTQPNGELISIFSDELRNKFNNFLKKYIYEREKQKFHDTVFCNYSQLRASGA